MKPKAYFLSYDQNSHSINIHIHQNLIPSFQTVNPENLYLRYRTQLMRNASLESDIQKNFGFRNCSVAKGIIDDYVVLSFPIPPTAFTDNPCEECEGTGTSKHDETRTCYFCKGTKKQKQYRDLEWYAICVTLSLLFAYLLAFLSDEETLHSFDQHIMLFTSVENSPGRMGIGGSVSRMFLEYGYAYFTHYKEDEERFWKALSQGRVECLEALSAMTDLWGYMNGTPIGQQKTDFRASIQENGYFYVEVPGQNGCTAAVSDHGPSGFFWDGGKSIHEHNVDSSQQQLVLLVGVLMIHNEIINLQQNPS